MPDASRTAGERRPWPWAAAAAALAAALVLAVPPAPPPLGAVGRSPEVLPASSVTAEVAPGVQLRIERPAAAGLVPVILHVPGGGWRGHDRTDVTEAFGHRAALDDGWAVATLRYRPAGAGTGVSADEQAADVEAALRWLHATGPAAGLGSPVVASGHSAGAHLLALATARSPRERQPAAVVLVSGVYDFAPDVLAAPMLAPVVGDALGCPAATCGAAALLPAAYADPGDAPVTVIHGTSDPVTPMAGAVRYADAAASAGVRVTLELVGDGGHLGPRLAAAVRRAMLAARWSVAT